MSWIIAIGIAAACFCAMALLLGLPRNLWAGVGAALLLGLAGYGSQANPDQPGAPQIARNAAVSDGKLLVEARMRFRDSNLGSKHLIISDGFARRGDYANAAGVLRGATRKNPKDAEAWLAMANALTAHADGNLSPAALYAYDRAVDAAPGDPGPAFFKGVAMIRAGKLIEAHLLWGEALDKTPSDAPWRADIEMRLRGLEDLLRRIAGQEQ